MTTSTEATLLAPTSAHKTQRMKRRTPSKSWKDNLRQACLDRARRRQLQRRQGEEEDGEHAGQESVSLPVARAMVEEELRQQGVSVISPCMDHNNRNNEGLARELSSPHQLLDAYEPMMDDARSAENDATSAAHHYLTEDELFALLESVEEEIQRADADFLEDIIHQQEEEQFLLEDQVAEYEQWQAQEAHASNNFKEQDEDSLTVLCPVCNHANLIEAPDGCTIICPNIMDGSCSLELTATTQPGGQVSLLHLLHQQLLSAYQQHTETECHGDLTFEMMHTTMNTEHDEPTTKMLNAVCHGCSSRVRLV